MKKRFKIKMLSWKLSKLQNKEKIQAIELLLIIMLSSKYLKEQFIKMKRKKLSKVKKKQKMKKKKIKNQIQMIKKLIILMKNSIMEMSNQIKNNLIMEDFLS